MNARIVAMTPAQDGNSVSLTFETKKGPQSLKVAKVLVLGRREANVEGLHLDRIGLSIKNGVVPVDSNLMTPIKSLYAIGDAVGGRYAAQKAIRDGTLVVRHLSGETVRVNDDLIPICLYTSPEVAYIGLTQTEAEKRGYDVEVGYFPFAAGARAVIFGQGEGIVKLVFEKRYGEILGAHIIGPRATELISLASMAMKNQLGLREIEEVVYAHPSFSESFLGAVNDALSMMT